MSDFGGAAAMLLTVLGSIGGLFAAHRVLSVATSTITSLPFLSGYAPTEHALARFHARWYPMSLLFLAFDVEMLFMYPWALIVADVGVSAIVEMFAFLGVLLVAVVWARREGALRWV